MAKRQSQEARTLEYFTLAPLNEALLLLGLVKDTVRRRQIEQVAGAPAAKKQVVRRKRKANAASTDVAVVPGSSFATT